jgi:hypothetical protein
MLFAKKWPAQRPQSVQQFAHILYASHAGSLALQDALKAGDAEPHAATERLRMLLDSPRLLKRRLFPSNVGAAGLHGG